MNRAIRELADRPSLRVPFPILFTASIALTLAVTNPDYHTAPRPALTWYDNADLSGYVPAAQQSIRAGLADGSTVFEPTSEGGEYITDTCHADPECLEESIEQTGRLVPICVTDSECEGLALDGAR